jgi:integrase
MYWIKYYRYGKYYVESTKSHEIGVAEKLLKMREAEIIQGKLPSITFERMKFKELVDDFLTDYRINKKKSCSRAERSANFLLAEFEGMRAMDINTPRIKKYIEKRMEQGIANATINRELSALKRIFNLAVRCTPSKIAHVPYIPMLKENNVRKGFIEHEDYEALLKELPEHLKSIVTFAFFTGWRKSEILNLKWNQVNLKEGTVRLEPGETKNDEGRTIYLEPNLLEVMTDLYKNRRMDCLYVFHRKGIRINDLRKSWATACDNIGRPNLLFHDLRRSGIRNMIRAGIPERVAMMISGHKTRSVFDRYNIVSQEDLKEAASKLHVFRDSKVA